MEKMIIRVGDGTSHNGRVITGSPEHSVLGRAIARLGDLVNCPQFYPGGRPHGVNKIITASGYLIGDIPAACDGDLTECGCTLIGTIGASSGK